MPIKFEEEWKEVKRAVKKGKKIYDGSRKGKVKSLPGKPEYEISPKKGGVMGKLTWRW